MSTPSIITGAQLSFSTKFLLNTTPKRFSITDNTPYSSYSIPLTNVFGTLTIVSPSGITIYQNATYTSGGADVWVTNSIIQQTTVALPALTNGYPEQGDYKLTYNVSINDGTHSTYIISSPTVTYTLNYASPTVSLQSIAECYSPLFTTTDETNYIVNNITPTNSRTLTLQFPANSGGVTITNTTSATIVTSTFYTGLQVSTVSSVLTYTFPDGLIVVDTVTGSRGIDVDCNLVCDLYCCLSTLESSLANLRTTNQILYQSQEKVFEEVMTRVELMQLAVFCGKPEEANTLMAEIRGLANCTTDCQCSDGQPRLVQGLGTQNVNVVVTQLGAPVVVTSNVSGGITTYTVGLSSAFVNLVNASYNTTVTSNDSSVTIVASGSNPKNYDLSVALPTAQNRMEFLVELQYATFNSPTVTITKSNYLHSGANMNATATVVATDAANPNWGTMNNSFTVSAFQVTPNSNFKVTTSVSVNGVDFTLAGGLGTWTATQMEGLADMLKLQIYNKVSGAFSFKFVNNNMDFPIANNLMVCFPTIYVSIKISE